MNQQTPPALSAEGSTLHRRHHNKVLLTIAIFKLLKASAVAAAGVTAIVFRNAYRESVSDGNFASLPDLEPKDIDACIQYAAKQLNHPVLTIRP